MNSRSTFAAMASQRCRGVRPSRGTDPMASSSESCCRAVHMAAQMLIRTIVPCTPDEPVSTLLETRKALRGLLPLREAHLGGMKVSVACTQTQGGSSVGSQSTG